jgi:peptidoglycan/LPS O-acetylase OafA/YrhL
VRMPDAGLQGQDAPRLRLVEEPDRSSNEPVFYLPQLDALRFFAFLCVFLLHTLPAIDVENHPGWWRTAALVGSTMERSGENGVELFFLLSSYLITELLTREKRKTGDIRLKMFYIRRILRIWPLYYFMVLLGLAIQPLSPAYRLTESSILSFLFFASNWHLMFHGFIWSPIYPLWTVSTEEQFYLIWPLAMRTLSRPTLLQLSAFAIIVVPLVAYRGKGFLWRTGTTESIVLLLFFPLGALLSMALKKHSAPLISWKALGMFSLGLACWLFGGIWARQYGPLIASSPSAALIGKSLIGAGTVLIFLAFLRSNPMIWPRNLLK